jgi:hypothetical protein
MTRTAATQRRAGTGCGRLGLKIGVPHQRTGLRVREVTLAICLQGHQLHQVTNWRHVFHSCPWNCSAPMCSLLVTCTVTRTLKGPLFCDPDVRQKQDWRQPVPLGYWKRRMFC